MRKSHIISTAITQLMNGSYSIVSLESVIQSLKCVCQKIIVVRITTNAYFTVHPKVVLEVPWVLILSS